MRHAVTMLSLCIALISGIVLALSWGQPPFYSSSIQAGTGSDVEETASALYQAINAYLDGGDDAPLRRMLHPDFVNHDPGGSAGGNADTFLRQLDSIRGLHAGIQLAPEVMYVGNNAASVSLSVSDHQKRQFAGIGIDPVEVLGRLDLVRIERGLIVERWSSAPLAGELAPYSARSIDLPISIHTLVARVQQLSLDGASGPTTNPFGHLLLIVQSGEVALDVMGSATIPAVIWSLDQGRVVDPAPIEPGTTITLEPMEAVLLPAGTQFRMWESSHERVELIALEFGPPVSGDVPATQPLLDALGETVWSGISLTGVGDRLTLSFGRATLLPQAKLSTEDIEGTELIWIGGGSIEMAASRGEVRVHDATGARAQLDDGHALLQTGDVGAAGPGSDIAYRAAGNTSATVWLFSIVPDGIETSGNDDGGPAALPTARPPRTAS